VTLWQIANGAAPIPMESADETKREADEFTPEMVTFELSAQEMPALSAISDDRPLTVIETVLAWISIGSRAEIVTDSSVSKTAAWAIEIEVEFVEPVTVIESA
jgi:hypothetical protein